MAHRNSYVHDLFNSAFLSQKCMSGSSFYDLIFKVQGPVEVDMFGENLEVVGLRGRVRHIVVCRSSWRNLIWIVVAADHTSNIWAHRLSNARSMINDRMNQQQFVLTGTSLPNQTTVAFRLALRMKRFDAEDRSD